MKAHELAKILLDGPDLNVWHGWGGTFNSPITHVWVAQGGGSKRPFIATMGAGQYVFYDLDRPEEVRRWHPSLDV